MRQVTLSIPQQALQQAVREYILGIYQWMVGGLLLTGTIAAVVSSSPALLSIVLGSPIIFFGLIIGELGLVVWLSARIDKMSVSAARAAFLGYAALNGLTLSAVFVAFTEESIAVAFFSAAGMYAVMAVYGYLTKRDLSSLGSFALMGVFGILIALLVNLFLQSDALDFAISLIGVGVFAVLTAYDMQRLKAQYVVGEEATAVGKKKAILGALALYLDFINLFLFLLRLLGGNRD